MRLFAFREFYRDFLGLRRDTRSFSQMGSCRMCRIKMPFVSDDKFDAILPVAGTLAALIALLVILIV
jgi:hypothetical protein